MLEEEEEERKKMIATRARGDTRAPLARAECADSIRATSMSRVTSSDHCFQIVSHLFTTHCCLTIVPLRTIAVVLSPLSDFILYIYIYIFLVLSLSLSFFPMISYFLPGNEI